MSTSYLYHPLSLGLPPSPGQSQKRFCLGPRAPQRAPYFCSPHQKAGASGQSSTALEAWSSRNQDGGSLRSPDASSPVDVEQSRARAGLESPPPGNKGCRPLRRDASPNARTATLSSTLPTAPRRAEGSNPCHSYSQMRRRRLKAFNLTIGDFPEAEQ